MSGTSTQRTPVEQVEERSSASTPSLPALQDGDLIFARREGSTLGWLSSLTDDPFHHMGIVMHLDEPTVFECTFNGCESRPLAEFVEHYDEIGLLHVQLEDGQRADLREVVLDAFGSRPCYAWDEMFMGGLVALYHHTQGSKDSMHRGALVRSLESAVSARNAGDRRALFCTTFVRQCFGDAGLAQEVLGPLAPPADYVAASLDPTSRDRTMMLPKPVQASMNVGSMLLLLGRAMGSYVRPRFDSAPPMSTPSDFWRHTLATGRVLIP